MQPMRRILFSGLLLIVLGLFALLFPTESSRADETLTATFLPASTMGGAIQQYFAPTSQSQIVTPATRGLAAPTPQTQQFDFQTTQSSSNGSSSLPLFIGVGLALALGGFVLWSITRPKASIPTPPQTTSLTPTVIDPFSRREDTLKSEASVKSVANTPSAPPADPFAARMARKAEPDFSQSLEEPGYPLPQPAAPTISAFVSYRRKPSAMLATFLARELSIKGINAFVDTRAVDGAGPFPERLLENIEECDVFVCLLGEGTFDSEWVRREVAHAHTIGKPMIPVFQESYIAKPDPPDEHIAALLQNDGIHVLDIRNIYIDEAIQQLTQMIQRTHERRA